MSSMWKMLSSSIARSCATRSSQRYGGRCRMLLARPYLICGPIATVMFSSTVRLENRRMFWKVRAIPAWFICAVLMPWMSLPSSRMVPWVGWYTLVSRLKTVVLPAPFGPIRPAISVRPMVILKLSTAFRPPKLMPRSMHSSTGVLPTSRSVSMATRGVTVTSLVLLVICLRLLFVLCGKLSHEV